MLSKNVFTILLIASVGFCHHVVAEETEGYQSVIEEIVVTARKREESLQDVPTAISAFGAEDIARYNIDSIDVLANFTPGLMVSESSVSSGGDISLRGVGSGSSNFLGDQPVSINVDGMQVGTLNIRKNAQIDLAQIEVLRGPQALFFGKNSPGGVISFKTADPTDERELEFSGSFESTSDDTFYQAVVSGPISETTGARLVARYTDLGGHFKVRSVPSNGDPLIVQPHVSNWPSGEEFFVRGTLLANPTEELQIRTKVSYSESKIEGGSITSFQRYDCPFGTPQLQPDFPCRANDTTWLGGSPPEAIGLVAGEPTSNGLGLRENEQFLSTLEVQYDLSSALTLSSVTGYYHFDEINAHNASIGPRATVLVPYLPFEQRQFTQELRLTSEFDTPINFMVGAFYETKDTEAAQDAVLTVFPPAPFAFGTERMSEEQDALSAFAQVIWDITDRIELSGGLRYSEEEKDLEIFDGQTNISQNLATDSLSFDNVSPELTISYDITDEIMLFGSYKEGFKSGGFDAGFSNGAIRAPGFENTFDEEIVTGFEAGLKANFGGVLALNVTAYSFEYEDLQVGAFDSDTISFKVQNAAEATVEGIEGDVNWLTPIDGVSIRASIAYNSAEYDQFRTACYTGQTPALGCRFNLNPLSGAFQEQDLSGRNLPSAPELTGTFGILYSNIFSNGLGLEVGLNAFYSDEYFGNVRQSPQDRQESFVKTNASLRLFGINDVWEVSLIGRNLNDEHTIIRSGAVTLTGGGTGTPGAVLSDRAGVISYGREVFLTFTYRPSRQD